MARFFTIASGSSGNSAFVGGGCGGVLIDAGVSCKAILSGLADNQVDVEQVKAIFITHEHIDHIRGLKVLLKKLPAPVYASAPVLDYLIREDKVPPQARLEEISGAAVQAAGMEISGFRTSHDSVHSLGYRILTADGRRVAVATDLGYVSGPVESAILGSDLALVESNYEYSMLMNGAYPYPLKRRIAGDRGHLSNDACADLLPRLVEAGSTRLILGHLSKENNLPDLARQVSLAALTAQGMRQGKDFTLDVAPRSQAAAMMVF